MTSKTLFRGGCVLTLGSRTPNYTQADVLIDDGKVSEIGAGLRARDAEVIDATDTIVMPGFVDTHRHVWKSLFRNVGESREGEGASAPQTVSHLSPDDVYAATLIGLLGAIEAGITTVVDWADLPSGTDFSEAALQAHADSGMRTVFVWSAPDAEGLRGEGREALRRVSDGRSGSDGSATTIGYGPSQEARLEAAVAADEWAFARELGLRIHADAAMESSDRGTIKNLGERGLLGADVTLVHCINVDDADLAAISSSGANVAIAPSSEMAGGLGPPPLQGLIDHNIRPGLAIDDTRVAPGDMFAQMRVTNSLQHATLFDLKLAGKAGVPQLLSTREVIRYATVDGAVVAGLGQTTGSLEPGKQADLIVLRADRPNIYPINDPIGAVVWGMDTSNVDWVFVAGKALLRNGELEGDVARAQTCPWLPRLGLAQLQAR